MNEIHLSKKDFNLDWFNGSGAGGQHRNKCANSVRITHIESGLTCVGQTSRSRVENQREAFNALAKLVILYYNRPKDVERFKAIDTIRNYHEPRNEVHDKASGLKQPHKTVVIAGDLSDMIDARKTAIGPSE